MPAFHICPLLIDMAAVESNKAHHTLICALLLHWHTASSETFSVCKYYKNGNNTIHCPSMIKFGKTHHKKNRKYSAIFTVNFKLK